MNEFGPRHGSNAHNPTIPQTHNKIITLICVLPQFGGTWHKTFYGTQPDPSSHTCISSGPQTSLPLLQVQIVWNDQGYEQRLVAHNDPKHAVRMQIRAAVGMCGFVHMYDGMYPHQFLL